LLEFVLITDAEKPMGKKARESRFKARAMALAKERGLGVELAPERPRPRTGLGG
jgi:hypothetical protein